jgi:hypothetical protein
MYLSGAANHHQQQQQQTYFHGAGNPNGALGNSNGRNMGGKLQGGQGVGQGQGQGQQQGARSAAMAALAEHRAGVQQQQQLTNAGYQLQHLQHLNQQRSLQQQQPQQGYQHQYGPSSLQFNTASALYGPQQQQAQSQAFNQNQQGQGKLSSPSGASGFSLSGDLKRMAPGNFPTQNHLHSNTSSGGIDLSGGGGGNNSGRPQYRGSGSWTPGAASSLMQQPGSGGRLHAPPNGANQLSTTHSQTFYSDNLDEYFGPSSSAPASSGGIRSAESSGGHSSALLEGIMGGAGAGAGAGMSTGRSEGGGGGDVCSQQFLSQLRRTSMEAPSPSPAATAVMAIPPPSPRRRSSHGGAGGGAGQGGAGTSSVASSGTATSLELLFPSVTSSPGSYEQQQQQQQMFRTQSDPQLSMLAQPTFYSPQQQQQGSPQQDLFGLRDQNELFGMGNSNGVDLRSASSDGTGNGSYGYNSSAALRDYSQFY